MTKQQLRKVYRKRRNDISQEVCLAESLDISRQLIGSEAYQSAEAVFVYRSFGSEFMTDGLIQTAFSDNKTVAVPKITGSDMTFYRIQENTEFSLNCYGIPEPIEASVTSPEDYCKVLLVLPGLCYDRNNGRIGYGGGYYDRYLAKYSGCSDIAVVSPALSCQYYEGVIPMEAHDVRPGFVIYPEQSTNQR